jgi:uncharacterized protein YyaL (SSP411 family)
LALLLLGYDEGHNDMGRAEHSSIGSLSQADLSNLPEDGGSDFNRLIFEKSPYLLQHAANPIKWYAWQESTLTLARKQDKPIFLSIGYSTCHWCHVMAEESFIDSHVAEIINKNYIPIKVDREERPDIDATYMQACQAMTGSGGWPLTLFLTPDLLPFFAATYIPKDDRQGMMGLISLLNRITDLWQSDRDKITDSGQQVFDILRKSEKTGQNQTLLTEKIFLQAIAEYKNQHDPIYGGFGQAPKFPSPHNLSLLIRMGHRQNDNETAEMALNTLRAIRLGGIYDQLAGGIHRYSVDERWLVPHFEKMLYDQSLLILACIDAWQFSSDPFYKDMALDVATYITRQLKSPDGAFFCGEDADSEGEEGTSYLWSVEQIRQHFDDKTASAVIRLFGISDDGNFEGGNILYLPEGLDDSLLRRSRKTLLPLRDKREQPHCDDKIITSWNGLTIAALSRLGAATGDQGLINCAMDAASFIKENLLDNNGRLLRRWRQDEAAIPAFLEDYVCLIWGITELYQAGFLTRDLMWAVQLTEEMLNLFSDGDGGLYDTGHDTEKILTRGRNLQDGAMPSGNGTAAMVLLRLGLLTGRQDFSDAGERLLHNNASLINNYPTAFSMSLIAADYLFGPGESLVIAGDEKIPTSLLEVTRNSFHPRLELIFKRKKETEIDTVAPIVAGKTTKKDQATAWLCRDKSCLEPVTDPGQLARLLQRAATTS